MIFILIVRTLFIISLRHQVMKKNLSVRTLLFVSTLVGCSPPVNNPTDGQVSTDASGDGGGVRCPVVETVMGAPLFMGAYTPATRVETETAMAAAVNTLRELPEVPNAAWWTMAAPMTTETAPAIELLRRADTISTATGTPNSLLTAFRAALAEGGTTMDANVRTAAAERFAKSLTAAVGIMMRASAHSAIASLQLGCTLEATQHWDRAAVYFTALDSKVRSRSMGMSAGVWGPGRDRLSEDDMVASILDKLTRGKTAITAGSANGLRSIGDELAMYLSRYYFLSVITYAVEIPSVLAMMESPLPPVNEGMTFGEGLIFMVNYARAESPAAVAMRARWRGPAAMINRNEMIRLSAGLYAEMLNRDLTAFAAADAQEKLSITARASGVLDALTEALRLGGANVSTLKLNILAARTATASGNAMEAVAPLTATRDAVVALSTFQPPMM